MTTNISLRLDSDLKKESEELFAALGITMTAALTMFLRQAVRRQGIPFEVTMKEPNAETIAAMLEAERIAKDPSTKRYSHFTEILAEIQAELQAEEQDEIRDRNHRKVS